MTDVSEVPARAAAPVPSAAELAERYGMQKAGARPPLGAYARDVWGRRYFVLSFARSRTAAGYSGAFLGQFWQVLTPLLNAAVYYLIFGLLLRTDRGVDNYIAFLVTGIFVFQFTANAVTAGAKAISGNLGITRALHFPRAVLPAATTMIALQKLLVSMLVLLPIVLATGERPTARWLLVVPAIALQTMFATGCGFAMARVGAQVPDTAQFLPFVMRTWLYLSGIFYSITVFAERFHHAWIAHVLLVNPAAVYIELVRDALLAKHDTTGYEWPVAVAWALVALVAGLVYFWRAEERYGRG